LENQLKIHSFNLEQTKLKLDQKSVDHGFFFFLLNKKKWIGRRKRECWLTIYECLSFRNLCKIWRYTIKMKKQPSNSWILKQTNEHNQLIFALFLSSLLSRQTPHSSIQTCTPRSTNTYYMAQNRNYHQSKHSKFFEEHQSVGSFGGWSYLPPCLRPRTRCETSLMFVHCVEPSLFFS